MPIQRFRDFEEARRALWVRPGDPALGDRIRRLWAFLDRLAPFEAPRGLRKYRTIEEANRDRDRWVRERVRELRRRRGSE